MRLRANSNLSVNLCFAAWIFAAAAGTVAFHWSMSTPGRASASPVSIDRPGRTTVLYFAHPHCQCSTATIDELAKRAEAGEADITVVITGPAADVPGWRESANAAAALRHGALRVTHDPEGSLAERFGALTSGHTVIYDDEGQLAFSGGLTSARGMVGPSRGLDALDRAISGRAVDVADAPVFGCTLFDHSQSDTTPGTTP